MLMFIIVPMLISFSVFLLALLLDKLFAFKEKVMVKIIAKNFIPAAVELLPMTGELLSDCSLISVPRIPVSLSEKFGFTVLVEGRSYYISVSRKNFNRFHLEDSIQVTCLRGFLFLKILSVEL